MGASSWEKDPSEHLRSTDSISVFWWVLRASRRSLEGLGAGAMRGPEEYSQNLAPEHLQQTSKSITRPELDQKG